MTRDEIAKLEHASGVAIAWVPEAHDDRVRSGMLLAALIPAVGILAVATTLLLAIL